jgi:uncharacterized protein YfaS (alpha-2-macroglobulin family)
MMMKTIKKLAGLRALRIAALLLAFSAAVAPAHGQDAASDGDDQDQAPNPTLLEPDPSNFESTVVTGQPFFLLTDSSFGSNQTAQVRLEAPGDSRDVLAGYGGADIVVYKVPHPLAFLKTQKNLHRIDVKPNYRGEGLSNTFAYLWSRWTMSARRAWERVFSYETRRQVTKARPEFKMPEDGYPPPRYEQTSRFAALPGYPVVARFRYPIWDAKTIKPPKGVKLEGSTSFIGPQDGKVMIPVGKLPPGLYLVEAVIGDHSAHTLLFVSDTVAVIKSASNSLLAWTARRDTGKPVAGTEIDWTDGMGVLQSGKTGADGVLELAHVAPERSYVIGSDPEGGVFISENFYYDSEIYNTKIYAATDRPLYRPGDTVHVKFIGRAFQSATQSTPAAPATIKLDVLDPNGSPIASQSVAFTSASGGDTRFTLPSKATGGGYTLRFDYLGDTYGAAFRVARYVKPHFDVNLVMDKPDYATGQALKGRISLRYPDGKPVKNGKVSITLRAQKVTMVEGELRYAGLFPIKLDQQELRTDDQGNVALDLPAAKEPSRYALTVFAQDGASYRVRVTREILIARGATSYRLAADKSFSAPDENVPFTLTANINGENASGNPPATWEWVRLESQTRASGTVPAVQNGKAAFDVKFSESGSYMLSVKDKAGNLLAAASHWVSGEGLKTLPGSVEIELDKPRYRVGDTAEALITFPYPVDDALLTLERDKVEARSLLSHAADWLSLQRIAPTQWKARIKVDEKFAPNMTFSVLYVHDGVYAFQNAGIVVEKPAIAIAVKSDKPVYAPGDTVTLDLSDTFKGQPLPAHLTVSVVDEMVYLLQPEIAPNLPEFFYHVRRNNVRTTASLSFVSYDLATSALRGAPGGPQRGQYNERGVKVLERPRRDDIDTAAWQPDLVTDANGHAVMKFRMPDALARWRITVRAVSDSGEVGQRTAYIRSDKALYLKWSAPADFRSGDRPAVDLVAFNQGNADAQAQWIAKGAGLNVDQTVTLKPGANYLRLPQATLQAGTIDAALAIGGKEVDRLQTPIRLAPTGWPQEHQIQVPLTAASNPLSFAQADAYNVHLRFVASDASQFARVADDLIAYPYGCTEQTSSRLIPLALAHEALLRTDPAASVSPVVRGLDARLRDERQRLALLAGFNGTFGWWGDGGARGDAFLTAYAYYADKLAADSLGVALPASNWRRALDVYRDASAGDPLLQRTLTLWLLQQMGLPVATQLTGVAEQLAHAERRAGPPASAKASAAAIAQAADAVGNGDSLIFSAPDSALGRDAAVVLAAYTARSANAVLPAGFKELAAHAGAELAASKLPLAQSLALMAGGPAAAGLNAGRILAQSGAAQATIDRSLTLLWLRKAMKPQAQAKLPPPTSAGGTWAMELSPAGAPDWRWQGKAMPRTIDLGSPQPDATAWVSYRSATPAASSLPVGIERALFRLDPIAPKADEDKDATRGTFVAHLVAPGEALDSNALYVDQVTLTPQSGTALHYGLLEVPLPPGGSVEATSWGVGIAGLPGADKPDPQPFQRAASYEMGDLSYHQPVPLLAKPTVLRQLVRFALPGTFQLPPARYFRMYQPQDQAYEGGRSDRLSTLTIK